MRNKGIINWVLIIGIILIIIYIQNPNINQPIPLTTTTTTLITTTTTLPIIFPLNKTTFGYNDAGILDFQYRTKEPLGFQFRACNKIYYTIETVPDPRAGYQAGQYCTALNYGNPVCDGTLCRINIAGFIQNQPPRYIQLLWSDGTYVVYDYKAT